MKKFVSIILTLVLILTTCLIVGMIPVKAETTKTWLDFEAKEMPHYIGDYGWDAWSIDPTTPYNCATWNSWGYTQKNGAWAIRELVVPSSGTLTVEAIWGAAGYYHGGNEGDTIQFAIANDDKELVYPATGELETIEYGEKVDPALSISVEAGDSIYFIMGNPSKASLSYYMTSIIRLNGTQLQGSNGWHYGNTDGMSVQGGVSQNGAKWYYKYADSVSISNLDPDAYTDNGGDLYTATYTVKEMTNLKDVPGSSRTDGWGCGGGFNDTGVTFAQGFNIYPRAGQTAIVRYTAPEHGYFDIGYCGVELYNDWGANQGVDFAIIDSNGKVIYPEYGGPVKVRGGSEPGDKSTVPSRLYHYNMEAGDYLDFVFIPTATTPNTYNYISYVNMSGSFSFNGKRVDSSGRLNLTHNEAQGNRGVTMLYSTDIEVEKTIRDEWTDYVQLSKTFTAAPTTVEAYVNIPANVPDWKKAVIISDMGGADEVNGFEASVDFFGHPRFTLAGGAVDVTFEDVDLRTGKWEHIAFTFDAATGEAKFYLNGSLADTKTAAAATLTASNRKAVIGNDMTYTKSSAFQGAMKKLAVYSDVRTADEILTDMAGVSASADALIGYWVLNGSYTDKSSNANTGVLTNIGTAWYKADAPADAKDGEFTIVHIGDQQVATDFIYGLYPKMTEWLAANKERLNIKAVINTGDLVNNEETQSQWNDATNGTNKLLDAKIPYIFAIGNHEYPASGTKQRDPSKLNAEFPISTYFTQGEGDDTTQIIYSYPNTEKLTTVDALTNESIENAVYVQTINGKTFIYFAFEVQPRDVVVDWANIVMPKIEAEYPNATTIVGTHHYLTTAGKIDTTLGCFTEAHRTECNSPAEFYDNFVKKYKSISLVLNGHVASDIATRTDIGVNGNKIVSIMNDPSYEGDGGQGVMLLLRYKADGTVKAEYYSPLLDAYYKANSQFEFDTAAPEAPSQYWLDFDAAEMPHYNASYNGAKTWYVDESDILDCLMQPAMSYASPDGIATIRKFVAPKAGEFKVETIWGTTGVTVGKTSTGTVKVAITDGDGKVLWPTDGKPATLNSGTTTAITLTGVQVAMGDEINFITYAPTAKSLSVTLKAVIRVGSTQYHDGGNLLTDFSSQGNGGWYFMYANGVKELSYNPNNPSEGVKTSCEVAYSATEGGTITAQTGGTWAADKLTIEAGGTAYFTTKPAKGYRFAGYYIDGRLCCTDRRLVYCNVTSDMVVEARFEKIKVSGDANDDGSFDLLDLVIAAKYPENAKKEMIDLYDDNIIDEKDTAEIRAEFLK